MAKKLTKEQVKKLTHNIPSSRYPWTLETYYARQLRKLVAHWKQIASDHLNRLIKPTVKGGSLVLTDDDDDHSADIALAITIMLSAINNSETDMILGSMATRYVNSVSNFSYHNVQAQAKHVGQQVAEHNSTIDSYMAMKIKENVALIKSMRSDFSSRLEKNIYEAISQGKGISQITSLLTKNTQMTNKITLPLWQTIKQVRFWANWTGTEHNVQVPKVMYGSQWKTVESGLVTRYSTKRNRSMTIQMVVMVANYRENRLDADVLHYQCSTCSYPSGQLGYQSTNISREDD